MERNSDQTKKSVRSMMSPMMSPMMTSLTMSTQMSLDAIHAFDQMKLKDKSVMIKPNHSHHHHRHHQQQATTTNRRPSHAGYSEELRPKSVSMSPASATACQMRRMRFASDEQHPSIRTPAAAADKHRNGKKSPTAATARTSILSKTVSSNQSTNHSFLLWKQKKKQDGGGIRSREQQPNACRRTSVPMRDNRKPYSASASFAHPNNNNNISSSSREANAMNRMRDGALLFQLQQQQQQQQLEKPFRISAMGYDSRYEDLIYESQRCVDDDDDVAPEETARAIDKCRLWLKKHHVDHNYGGRRVNYYH